MLEGLWNPCPLAFLTSVKRKSFKRESEKLKTPQDHPAMDSDEQRDNIVWKESIEIVKDVCHDCIVFLTI